MSPDAGLAAGQATAGRAVPAARWVALVETTKPRSVVLLGFVGLAAGVWAVSASRRAVLPVALPAGGAAAPFRLALGVLAVVLGSMGTNSITGYIDRAMDALMLRTRHRPVPTGRLAPEESLRFGLLLVCCALGIAALTGSPWSVLWLLFGVVDVAVVYNWLSKPRTPWSVVLGSPAGGAPVLVVCSAITGLALQPVPALLAALVTVWTPIHVWSLAIRHVDDYRAARVPTLPAVIGVKQAARCLAWTTLALCALALVLPLALELGSVRTWIVIGCQVPLLVLSVATAVRPDAARSWSLFKLSSPYLALLFLVVATV